MEMIRGGRRSTVAVVDPEKVVAETRAHSKASHEIVHRQPRCVDLCTLRIECVEVELGPQSEEAAIRKLDNDPHIGLAQAHVLRQLRTLKYT